jgi:hypothetical protein
VPRAEQASVLIDVAAAEVRTEMAASARQREVPPIGVADGVATCTHHLTRWEIGGRADPVLCIHDASAFTALLLSRS